LTPPRHLGSYPPDYDGEREEAPLALDDARELRGTAASQGEATGTARIVMSPDDFHKIQPGDVLVCRSTAPMWTPLFEVISGLVSEAGGILSHPAVVAREFGLPAVVGVRGATGLIEDGSIVTVSGNDGIVRRAD
jgi:pyruvate,water dikinase